MELSSQRGRTVAPVFVVGCQRSGTTLLGAMLGSHSAVLPVPEAQFLVHIIREIEPSGPEFSAARALALIEQHFRFQLWDLDLRLDARGFSSYAELIRAVVEAYGEAKGKPFGLWVDHTPENIRHLPTLFDLFPDARAVHIIRDGRAVASSIRQLGWKDNSIQQLAELWIGRVAFGLAAESCFGPERVIRVRYEDLVWRPVEVLGRICKFAGLDYQRAMLDGEGFEVPQYTLSQHALVGQRPDPGRADAWRERLRPREIELFEHFAGGLLQSLGYEVEYGGRSVGPTRREQVLDLLDRAIGAIQGRWVGYRRRRRLLRAKGR